MQNVANRCASALEGDDAASSRGDSSVREDRGRLVGSPTCPYPAFATREKEGCISYERAQKSTVLVSKPDRPNRMQEMMHVIWQDRLNSSRWPGHCLLAKAPESLDAAPNW